MAIKTYEDIVKTLIATIQSMQPIANLTTGTFQRDVLIDAPASEMAELFGEIRIAQEAQSIRDASGLHLDRLLANYAIYRKPGEKATGSIWFRRLTAPVIDTTIPSGTRVRTITTNINDSVEFITSETVVMLASQASVYYNADEDLYEIESQVEAAYRGIAGNVGPNTITAFTGTTDISLCTNKTSTTGGTNAETDDVFRARGLAAVAGTNAGTKTGYEVLIEGQALVQQVSVVDPNDPEMERVRDGGGADIWIKTDDTAEATDTYSYSDGEVNRVLANRPSISISAVREDGILLVPGVDYGTALDTGVYARSIYSNDRIWWITERAVGSSIEITYVWSELISTLQTLLDGDQYHHAGADILTKLSYEARVDVTLTVEIFSGYTADSVTASVNNEITTYINNLKLGEDVQQSDIIALAEVIPGVDSVVIPFTTFQVTREQSGIVDPPDYIEGELQSTITGNLQIRRFEYSEAGTVSINYYT